MQDSRSYFLAPGAVASYAEDAARKVPGLADLHRMATLLLSERAPGAARILVVGAGGGLELKAMAAARADWRFIGVDPSPAMLGLASQAVVPFAERIHLVTGTVDLAPAAPFDGATCLLTLHFLDRSERLRTLQEIRRRLRPGARLVVAHHVALDADPERWLARSAAFGAKAHDGAHAAAMGKVMAERLPLLAPAAEEELLREAGFAEMAMFYAALSLRGWIASAG